jgi:hypothetical protein
VNDWVIEHLAAALGIEKARMVAAVTPYLFPGAIAALGLYAAYSIGVKERLREPVIDIDCRKTFQKVIQDKKWIRANTETDPEKLTHLRSDYLKVRLSNQIHDFLAQSKMTAHGELSLTYGTGPSSIIPADKWQDVVISFGEPSNGLRSMAVRRDGGGLAYVDIMFSSAQVAKLFHVSAETLKA